MHDDVGGVGAVGGPGTATSVETTSAPPHDPVVTERLEATIANTEHLGDPTYQIQETLADPSLTDAQKDEYIARLVELSASGDVCTEDGLIMTAEAAAKFQAAFQDIGLAYTGPATPELRTQVTDSIARNVASGRLTADDLYTLVDPRTNPASDGARQLLTGITDGAVLNSVADRLLTDAKAMGYDVFDGQLGVHALTAAADIANMAADHGYRGAANAIVREIDRQTLAGPVSGDLTIVQAMMQMSVTSGEFGSPLSDRTGFNALAGLLNSATSLTSYPPYTDDTMVAATDRLFAGLVRSGDDFGGIDDGYINRTAAFGELGAYFNANAGRLLEADWRAANTTDPHHHRLVQDFMQHVMLDPAYEGRETTADVISAEIDALAAIVGDGNAPAAAREEAASTLGTLMGSLEEASRRHVEDAGGDYGLVQTFTDLVAKKLLARAGPVGAVASNGVNPVTTAIFNALTTRAENQAQAEADEALGGMADLVAIVRTSIQNLEAYIPNAFDLRVDLYYDGPTE